MTGPAVTRRRLLGGGGAAALLALSGCGGSSKPRAASRPRRPTLPQPSEIGPATDAQWRALGSSLSGRLVRPGDPGYATAIQLYDFRYDDVHPAGVAYCATEDDVARAIGFAREHGIIPRPRAGGHSYAGYSTGPGLVVDVTLMRGVVVGQSVVAGQGTATVGAGARLVDVYTALNARGVSVPAGSCPTVGLAGLALGGGIGVMVRSEGLTSDRVESLRMVTTDARTVTASAADNAELYWACRGGGGGNFGVVTSFALSTFPTAAVALFTLTWPWAAAGEVLPAWLDWVDAAPEALWANCLLSSVPGGSPTVVVTGVYRGAAATLDPLLARLTTAAGSAASTYVESVPFAHAMYVEAGCASLSQAQCRLPSQGPSGRLDRAPSLARSDLLTEPLAPAAVALVVDAIEARQDAGLPAAAGFDALGGVASQPAADATAWVHRDARWSAQYSTQLAAGVTPAALAADEAWLGQLYGSLRPFVSGQAYQNYIDPLLTDWPQAYYGANLPRLEAVRSAWDPDAVLRFAQVITRA